MKTTPTHSSEEKATPISRTGSGWISISNLACLLAIAAVPAHAQTNSQTWDGGGGDNNWSTAANWTNDTVPINQFVDFAGTTRTNPNNDIAAGKYIYEMRLKNTTSGQSFTLDGNSVFVHNAVRTYDVASGNITDVINMNIDTLNGHWVTGTNHDLTMNGLAGSGSDVLIKSGGGTLTLAGANTYTGATTVNAGTLKVTNSSNTPSYTIASGATLDISATPLANTTFTGTGTLEVTGGVNLAAISGTFSMGSGAYIDVKSGGGQIVSNGGNDPWTGSLADVNVDGWLYVANNNLNVDALTGSGLVNMGTSTIVVGLDDGSGTFDGNVRSSYNEAHFRKEGSGTQTLNGELKLDKDAGLGSVTVNEGTLIINGDATGTTGAWTVNAGATLTGSGSLGGTATIGDGATLSPGNSPGTQTFDNLTWVNGGTYLWEINADLASGGGKGVDSGWDWIDVTNTFDLSGITTGFNIDITSLTTGNIAGLADGFDYSGKSYLDPYESFTILSFGSLTGDFDASEFNLLTGNFANPKVDWSLELSGNDLVLNAVFVPEPSSTALLGLGGLALMLRRKRS